MRTTDIRTNQTDIACDICGRTLLRGEHAEDFLAAGQRRQVCELCTARAQHEGWIRESGGDDLALRHPRGDGRGRSFIERFRARRERAREVNDQRSDDEALAPRSARAPSDRGRIAADNGAAPEPPPAPPRRRERERERDREEDTGAYETPRRPRHVRAVPTNADLKMERALEVFNSSDHTRTVGGVARSLGAPEVSVRPLSERPSVVAITVMWELSWYRYEVDLSDEAGGVRRDAQGDELSELSDDDRTVNAAADDRGGLHLQ
jgi:hypothetical protein